MWLRKVQSLVKLKEVRVPISDLTSSMPKILGTKAKKTNGKGAPATLAEEKKHKHTTPDHLQRTKESLLSQQRYKPDNYDGRPGTVEAGNKIH
ncbi:uncharacterized protein SPSK_04666 [Sporothrix schenckii 1099-18]|uniref:Uncharacterized protein n=1 Tax=Sporothrix schenckii 1099-18 TaxID=1397361 RepID=A0A0F2M4A5_SPOSC|nr:uncharacterized protein SPSK_04666 [Sporothrix schenckii 1099-18]KJR83001.1 hypothetical protein SPSK_04666 [Sporothrix schenckii 1099-18]